MACICFVCEKEVKDTDEYDFIGLDGDRVHLKCKPNVDKKMNFINNLSDVDFYKYMIGNLNFNV